MNNSKITFKKTQRGQGMVEYIIIVALIAIAAIGVYSQFGKAVRGQVAGMTQELSGKKATTGISTAKNAATNADATAKEKITLGNYDKAATTAAEK